MKSTSRAESRVGGSGLWPRQAQAFFSHANEQLFGGASEGGKSYYGRYKLSALCSAVPNLVCFIVRKYYGDVIGNHMDGPTGFPRLLERWVKDGLVKITENEVRFQFNNASIQLIGLLHDKDLEKHIGREKHVLWFDEAGQIPRRHIEAMRAWVRMPAEMKDLLPAQLAGLYPDMTPEQRREALPCVLYTMNPEGASVGYFRRGFIEGHTPFEIWRAADKDGGFLRQFVPSLISDNPSADQEAQRRRLLPLGEARARALITGDWKAPAGDFFKEWNEDVHVIDDFTPPVGWFKWRAFDWGSADPFSVGWYCVSDGEDFTDEHGVVRWFPRGAIIRYREWYGADDEDPGKGLHLANPFIAKGILERTKEVTSGVTLTDRLPFADRGDYKGTEKYTMADQFAEHGVPLTLANTKRIFGWQQMRTRLVGNGGVPMFYVCRSCKFAQDYIPALTYSDTNSEDAQESGEATHVCDEVRYALASRPIIQSAEKVLPKSEPSGTMKVQTILSKLNQKQSPYGRR